jgi:hypothetical protein
VFVVIFLFSFLIVLIWIFFSPPFSQISQRFLNLTYFLKEPAFFFKWFYGLYFTDFSPYFFNFLLLLALGLSCSSFSRIMRCSIRSFFEIFLRFQYRHSSYKLFSLICICCIPFVLIGCGFIFIKFKELFDFSLLFLLWPLSIEQFVIQPAIYFLLLLLLLSSSFIALWSDSIQGLLQFS